MWPQRGLIGSKCNVLTRKPLITSPSLGFGQYYIHALQRIFFSPLPRKKFHHSIRYVVGKVRIGFISVEGSERMREVLSWTPWHTVFMSARVLIELYLMAMLEASRKD